MLPRVRPMARALLVWLVLVVARTAVAGTTPSSVAVSGGMRLLPLEVRINGVKGGSGALLEKDDELHATARATAVIGHRQPGQAR